MKYFISYILILSLLVLIMEAYGMSWLLILGFLRIILWPLSFVYVVTLCKIKIYKKEE